MWQCRPTGLFIIDICSSVTNSITLFSSIIHCVSSFPLGDSQSCQYYYDETYWASRRSTSALCVLELTAMLCNVVYRAVSQTPQSWLTWKSRVLQNCPDPAWQPVAPAIPDLAREGRLVTVTVGIVRSELSSSLNYPMFLLSGETVWSN